MTKWPQGVGKTLVVVDIHSPTRYLLVFGHRHRWAPFLDRVLDVKNIDEMKIRKIGKSVKKKIGKRATSSEMEQPTPNGKLSATAVRRSGGTGTAVGEVGSRAVEEDIAALSARYRRDVLVDGNFLPTGRPKLSFPWATARASRADGCALGTRIFPGTRGRRTVGPFSLPRACAGALFCPPDVLLSWSAAAAE